MHYLFNTSVIWLVSLVAFELFFKQETVHWLNRTYLLGTLLLGLLLPLWRWQHHGAVVLDTMPVALQQAMMPHGAVMPHHALQQALMGHSFNWLLLLYGCGVLISLGMLLRTVAVCYRLQRGSLRTRHTGYTVVETGKEHGPFSFFRIVFVSSMWHYSEEEFVLVLRHELRHARLWHSADVLVLQLLRVALWFHPLVYWYDNRLRMVHEYEADIVGKERAAEYGQFLIEQALLQPAPVFTNALNHSPIKNRIMMLMRNKTSSAGLAKYLVVLPMLIFFVMACTQDKGLPEKVKSGNTVYFKGNEFELLTSSPLGKEERKVIVTGSITDIRVVDSIPVKMNGEKIYAPTDLTQQPVYQGPDSTAAAYLLAQIKNNLAGLKDGRYVIGLNDVVLDKTGHIAYYKYSGIAASIPGNFSGAIPLNVSFTATIATSVNKKEKEEALEMLKAYNATVAAIQKESEPDFSVINQKVLELLNDAAIHYTPATVNGYGVPAYLDDQFDFFNSPIIQVLNHRVSILSDRHPAKIVRYVP